MSKDYHNYSKPYQARKEDSAEQVNVPVKEENLKKTDMIDKTEKDNVEEGEVIVSGSNNPDENDVVADPETVVDETVFGLVYNCKKLNVRIKPDKEAAIICAIEEGAKVEIDEVNSTEDFHKVITESGISGYCMKQFIEVMM